jgi:hypothetical protein
VVLQVAAKDTSQMGVSIAKHWDTSSFTIGDRTIASDKGTAIAPKPNQMQVPTASW